MDNTQLSKALAIQKEVSRILETEEVYLVGGSVRDLVMNGVAHDYDFTTSMLPEEMIEKVKAAGRRVYTIGEKFGTIGFKVPIDTSTTFPETFSEKKTGEHIADPFKVKTTNLFEYVEVTTFRSEVYTSKSRKPEVQFVPSLEEDLARRDFTMNAMVLREDGTIFDPYGGKLDIYAKQIKTVGLPKDRIIEDPLRILRAARFAARYGFKIDPNFIGKARQLADRIFDVSVERWVQEMDKLLMTQYTENGYRALTDMGVAQRILPEIWAPEFNAQSDDVDIEWKRLLAQVGVLEEIKDGARVIRYINSGICARLKFSNERTNKILDKVKEKD